ncbi:MAG: 2-succinyl-5-enolpyruvyl-6-hydroxy-3-cyclohexene-1-carboxylic-acid synthase [Gammaproteobacteria bacterium]|nr:2-succinyl-5-enolpyruvyl-6-hydroxy-3-cyclohexene-1-carboxylic-acid synthase [Gammaproteobacteria bacterium]
MTGPNRNLMWAAALLDELARAGVREVVLAPGYRSAPLVMAAAADARLRVFTHLDERSAAFFALGVGKRARRPAAVITTSGTAVANLLPAVVEASYSEAPLLLLTADRPHRLRGADANQAIDQAGIFGRHVRDFVEAAPPEAEEAALVHLRALAARAVASSVGCPAGPVHLNLPFAKPLAPTRVPGDVPDGFAAAHPLAVRGRPEEAPLTRIAVRRPAPPAGHLAELAARVREVDRGLIVAGPSPEPERDGPAAKALAAATGYPLLPDALSGARFGDAGGALRIGGYDLFLGDAPTREALRPDLVLRLGASPTSANLLSLLEEAGGEQWVIDAGDRWKDHLNVASHYLRADVAAFAEALGAAMAVGSAHTGGEAASKAEGLDRSGSGNEVKARWHALWRKAQGAAARAIEEASEGELFEGIVCAQVVRAAPPGSTVFVSSSMPVRDLDAFALPRRKPLLVHGNRGASGIDGILSSAAGVAAGGEGPVLAIVGDVAFIHDMNGLLSARDHAEVIFVLVNNDGGGIFHFLPIRDFEPAFTRHFATPHGLDFAHAAALYGLPHERVRTGAELVLSLERAIARGGSRIIEVETDRERNRRCRRAVYEAVGQP